MFSFCTTFLKSHSLLCLLLQVLSFFCVLLLWFLRSSPWLLSFTFFFRYAPLFSLFFSLEVVVSVLVLGIFMFFCNPCNWSLIFCCLLFYVLYICLHPSFILGLRPILYFVWTLSLYLFCVEPQAHPPLVCGLRPIFFLLLCEFCVITCFIMFMWPPLLLCLSMVFCANLMWPYASLIFDISLVWSCFVLLNFFIYLHCTRNFCVIVCSAFWDHMFLWC